MTLRQWKDEGHRKKRRETGKTGGTVTHQQDGAIQVSSQGQLIVPVISQHSNVRKTPPSQPEASTWKPRLPKLAHPCPSLCLGRKRRHAERQGLARGHRAEADSPQVSQHPVKGSPSTLPKARMTDQHGDSGPALPTAQQSSARVSHLFLGLLSRAWGLSVRT